MTVFVRWMGSPAKRTAPTDTRTTLAAGASLLLCMTRAKITTPKEKGGDTMSENTDRSGYIAAITKLLEKADLRALRLIWLHAKGLTR